MQTYDVIVVGLGAMGAAAMYQLSKRNVAVLGIDQFSPPHTLGSSHGDTRITRQATGEGAKYAELSLRSRDIWREIEEKTGDELYVAVGVLNIAGGSVGLFKNAVEVAAKFGISCEVLHAPQIRERFPQFSIKDTDIGYFEPGAGYLRPEACVRTQLTLACHRGAEVHTNERVWSFSEEGGLVRVSTDRGEYRAKKLIVSAGAYLVELIGEKYGSLFPITRQVLYWFDIGKSPESFQKLPVFICDPRGNKTGFYGFPAIDGPKGGVKLAQQEQRGAPTAARSIKREIGEEETKAMFENFVGQYLPDLSPKCLRASACLYTNTSDFNFIIDWFPSSANVLVASPCSGHGFKHSAAIGEVLTQLALDGKSEIEVGEFSFARFL